MIATQARLPGTLPTSAQARLRLREASGAEGVAAAAVLGMHEHRAAARDELKAAVAELAGAERNMLAAEEGSEEETAAGGDQQKAWRRVQAAEQGIENLSATLKAAVAELAGARRQLRAAREDLEALRQGRRKR